MNTFVIRIEKLSRLVETATWYVANLAAVLVVVNIFPRVAYDLSPVLGSVAALAVLVAAAVTAWRVGQKHNRATWFLPEALNNRLGKSGLPAFFYAVWFIFWAGLTSFSLLSICLNGIGAISFNSTVPISVGTLSDYYAWHLVNMIPGLDVWGTLRVVVAIEPNGVGAGLLLLAFRVFVIGALFGLIKRWFDEGKKAKQDLKGESGSRNEHPNSRQETQRFEEAGSPATIPELGAKSATESSSNPPAGGKE